MREAWDRRPSPFAPAHAVFTLHVTPEIGLLHHTTHGSDCWCEPIARWCEDGCCRIIAHVSSMAWASDDEGLNG